MQASILLVFALASISMFGCKDRTSEQSHGGVTVPTDTSPLFEVELPAEGGLPEPEPVASEAEGAPGENKEAPAETQEPPVETEKIPAETEEAPGETREVPGEAAAAEETPEGTAEVEEEFNPTYVPTVTWLPDPIGVPESKAETEADMKPYTENIPATEVTFDMVPIRGGKFMMGSPDDEDDRNDDEGPQHEVAIEPFWMGKYEVTWDEYELWGVGLDELRRQVTGVKPTELDKLADAITQPTKPYSDMTFSMGKTSYPAICMSQLAARVYCKWLSAKTGRFYRLPTEAEWEYACRAETTTAYSFDDPDDLEDYGWYFDNADDKYHKVGQKEPNPWGLHDMHGNVSEWVLDQYIPDYYKKFAGQNATRPLAVPTALFPRVARGGCWDDDPDVLRSACRTASSSEWKMQDPQIPRSIWYHTESYCPGFRVVRPLHVPTVEEAKLYEPDYQAIKEYREAQGGKE
jgi:formylglycine-generating enzyme required for sulfatase activity